MQIPDYPVYVRELVSSLVLLNSDTDWKLVDKLDIEYYRVVEFFANKSVSGEKIRIDLSSYGLNHGIYWVQLDPSQVIKSV